MPTVIELNTDFDNAIRLPGWIALAVFSVVCVTSISSRYEDKYDDRGADVKWCLTVSIMSMLLAASSVVAYWFARGMYAGQVPEGVVLLLCLMFWCAGLPVMQNPERGIATAYSEVINANLYFFSWMSFAATLFMAGHYVQEFTGIDVLSSTPEKAPRWYALAASSLVVMISAVRLFKDAECSDEFSYYEDDDKLMDDDGTTFCRRCRLAISFGVIGFLVSVAMTFATHFGLSTEAVDLIVSTVLFVMWCFGINFITFGDSPGVTIGNLYFSSWLSFVLAVVLFGTALRDFLSGGGPAEQQQQQQQQEQAGMGVSSSPNATDDFGESYGPTSYPGQQQQHHNQPEFQVEDDI